MVNNVNNTGMKIVLYKRMYERNLTIRQLSIMTGVPK